MSKILLIQPNKWGRGITSIWIPSHAAALKNAGHDVTLFDCTFFVYRCVFLYFLSPDYSGAAGDASKAIGDARTAARNAAQHMLAPRRWLRSHW